jgi:hypothetical protein
LIDHGVRFILGFLVPKQLGKVMEKDHKMSTLEQRVLHFAQVWRETEKTAISAAEGKKNAANRAHHQATASLREAVDSLAKSKT